MPIYEFRCDCGASHEAMAPMAAAPPLCDACRATMRRAPGGAGLLRGASAGRRADQMPSTWRQTSDGDTRHVAELRREHEARRGLEQKYPELRSTESPVVAHEGRHHHRPLRVADVTTEPTAGAGS